MELSFYMQWRPMTNSTDKCIAFEYNIRIFG
jgi:hypothetical protein